MSDLSYMGGKGYSRGTDASKEQVNHHTGKMNDGALINKGRGPTVGNKGTKSTPGTSSLPAFKPGKEMFTGTTQVRTPGGTKELPKRGQSTFDFKRGPTKGNE